MLQLLAGTVRLDDAIARSRATTDGDAALVAAVAPYLPEGAAASLLRRRIRRPLLELLEARVQLARRARVRNPSTANMTMPKPTSAMPTIVVTDGPLDVLGRFGGVDARVDELVEELAVRTRRVGDRAGDDRAVRGPLHDGDAERALGRAR